MTPKIDAILDLLSGTARQDLQKIKLQFPQFSSLLEPGLVMGEQIGIPDANLSKMLLALAQSGIDTSEKQAKLILENLLTRARWVKRLKLYASIVAAITSLGVISATVIGKNAAIISTAIVNLVSTAAGLFAQHFDAPLFGDNSSLAERINECLNVEKESKDLKLRLLTAATPVNEIVTSANFLCARIRKVQVESGMHIKIE